MTDIEYLQLYGGVEPAYLGSDPNPLSTFGPSYVDPDRPGIMPLSNLGFSSPRNYTPYRSIDDVARMRMERGVHGRLGPEGDEVFYDHPALHDKITGPAGDYRLPIKSGGEAFEQEGRNYLVATDKFHNQDNWNVQTDPYQYSDYQSAFADLPVNPEEYVTGPSGLPGPLDSTAVASTPSLLGPTGPTGVVGPQDSFAVSSDPSLYGGSEQALASAATDSAADSASGWGGPETFVANQALNLINTRDRDRVNTPFGDEGSYSGMVKGAGKGALTGFTLGGPTGAVVGGLVGTGLATQGYFDSRTPPSVQMSRVRRGQGSGVPQGLLGGLYA